MSDANQPAAQPTSDEPEAAPVDNTPVDNAPVDGPRTVEELSELLEGVTAERDELDQKLTEAQEQAKEREAELVDQAQRVSAELANFRKRSAAESSQRAAEGVKQLAEQLLAVLDACDLATQHGDESVDQIAKLLEAKLADVGLARIAAVGEPFDPAQHEALRHEGPHDGPQEAGSPADGSTELWVVSQERAGYRFGDRVLRAAQVTVGYQAPGHQAPAQPDAAAEGH